MRVNGQFECWDGDGKIYRKELGGYDGKEKCWSVVCVTWKGGQREIVGGGCKLLRSGENEQECNGVGIVLSKELKEDMMSVSRKSERVMSIALGL